MSKSLLMLCFHCRLNGRVILIVSIFSLYLGFPGGSVVKKFVCTMGDARNAGLIPALGRSLGGGNGNPLQYSCQENSMDRGAWWATVHGVTKSWM